MSLREDRIAAIRKLQEKGENLSVSQVLDAVQSAWALSPLERAALEHEIARRQPLASNPAAKTKADEKAEAERIENDTHAVLSFRRHRELRQLNPFTAARFRTQYAEEIDRGAELDNDEPPPNAA